MLITPETDGPQGPYRRADRPRPGRGPAARAFWRLGGGLVVGTLLVVGVGQAIVALAHERDTLRSSFPAAGIGIVAIYNSAGGSVQVVGTDTDTIRVTTRVDRGLRSTGHSEGVEGDRLVLRSTCPILLSAHCRVGYELEVPTDTHVVVHDDAGHVSISDIDGDVEVSSDAGGIDLTRIGGSVQARTDAGGLDAVGISGERFNGSSDAGSVRVDFDVEPRAVVATSDAGSVEVVVPPGEAFYAVTVDSDAGSVTNDVRSDPLAERSIVATTDAGSVTVRYRTSG